MLWAFILTMLCFVFFQTIVENLGKAIDDCKKAIEFDPLLIKAHFRKAQIESMLRRYDQSLLSCLIGLHHEPENKELLALKKESER